MKSFCFVALFVVGLATAATQHQGPVYRSLATINSVPVQSDTPTSPLLQQHHPAADARDSPAYQLGDTKIASNSAGGTAATTGLAPATNVQTSVPQPQYYQQYAYAVPATTGQAQAYVPYQPQQQQAQQQQPQVYSNGVDYWTKYRMTDVMVGGAALALMAAGSYFVVPKVWSVRGRALRELSELDSKDLSRMAKSVFDAIDKVYDRE